MTLKEKISAQFYKPNKLYIIPTWYGLVFGGLNIATLMIASTYGNNLVYLLTFSMFGIYMASMLQTHSNLKNVVVHLPSVNPGFSGGEIQFSLALENKSTTPCPSLSLEVKWRFLRKKNHSTMINLAGSESQTAKLSIPVNKRGVYFAKRVTLSSIFPLGLWRTWTYINVDQVIHVYPTPLGSQLLPQESSGVGTQHVNFSTNGDDFSGHREYQQGHSIRHIDWKVYARSKKKMIKEFKSGGQPEYVLSWQNIHSQDSETKLSQITNWILALEAKNLQYKISLPGHESKIGLGPDHSTGCLKKLAEYQNDHAA